MKKIIFSLCIAIVACLSAIYVSASKTNIHYFYGLTETNTYRKIYENYEGTNCIDFTGDNEICGLEVIPGVWTIFPNSISLYDIRYWVDNGYLRPISYNNRGVYIPYQDW